MLEHELQHRFYDASIWMPGNKPTSNAKKTNYVLLGTSERLLRFGNMYMELYSQSIYQSRDFKYFDANINFRKEGMLETIT